MSKKHTIDRRDFISGLALTGAAFGLSPLEALAKGFDVPSLKGDYPPALTGMRGNHKGSFEVAHAVSWQGKEYARPSKQTDEVYDLIIVGGGISGLGTAHYARKKLGEEARILILDNHDDFGGHAKRNEFDVDGTKLLGHGGSQSIDSPKTYSAEAMGLLKDIGIDVEKFNKYYHHDFNKNHNLGNGLYLNKSDQFFAQNEWHVFDFTDDEGKENIAEMIVDLPLPDKDKATMHSIFIDRNDWMPDYSRDEKLALLKSTPYVNLLKKHGGLSAAAVGIFIDDTKTLMGSAWDTWSGLDALRLYHPGTYGLGIDPASLEGAHDEEPYIYHFPDGNASIARLLVKRLIPNVTRASGMEDIVTAMFDYKRLDRPKNATRIRLNSTAVRAENVKSGVEVRYVRDGKVERVIGKKAVMACYNHILPFIMPEMKDNQKDALQSVEKVPLAYVNVAVRNWRPWKKAGVRRFLAPDMEIGKIAIDYPVSIGDYTYTANPDEPTVILLYHQPNTHGLHPHEQARQGRHRMYSMSFADYERETRRVMSGALDRYGFDFDKDVAAITVNRWPHGYAQGYNELYDDPSFGAYHGAAAHADKGPHVQGRQKIGNIAIANSDSSAYAYIQGALDAAHRAIGELY